MPNVWTKIDRMEERQCVRRMVQVDCVVGVSRDVDIHVEITN